jgi:antitoxin (DNA-binding transcriptional repressor) of toxin-antitoxin stability system
MEQISISKFKATCLAVLERVRQTRAPILITKQGKVIAEINPPPETGGGAVAWFNGRHDRDCWRHM